MAAATTVDRLVFALNGQRYEVGGVDPSTRLLEFIRTQTPFKGPKLGCGEGMYGARVLGSIGFFLQMIVTNNDQYS